MFAICLCKKKKNHNDCLIYHYLNFCCNIFIFALNTWTVHIETGTTGRQREYDEAETEIGMFWLYVYMH